MAKKYRKLEKKLEKKLEMFGRGLEDFKDAQEREIARNDKRIGKLEESVKAQGGQIDSATRWIAYQTQTSQSQTPVVTMEFGAKKASKNQSA